MSAIWWIVRTVKFWHAQWWHERVLCHTVTEKEMPLPEFVSECSCGTWFWAKDFDWNAL